MGLVYFLEFRLNSKGMKNILKDFNKGSNMIQHIISERPQAAVKYIQKW